MKTIDKICTIYVTRPIITNLLTPHSLNQVGFSLGAKVELKKIYRLQKILHFHVRNHIQMWFRSRVKKGSQ